MIFARRFPTAYSTTRRRGRCHRSYQCHPFWASPSTTNYGQLYVFHDTSDGSGNQTSSVETKKDQADSPSSPSKLSPSSSLIYRGRNVRIYEGEEKFSISVDLPGIKSSDIRIRVLDQGILDVEAECKSRDNITSKFAKQFPLDEDSVDTDSIQANHADGVLIIDVPKKKEPVHKQEPKEVSITASYAPENAKTVLSVDAPGIKVENVQVLFHDGHLLVSAERRHGNITVKKMKFSYTVDTKTIETTQLQGYLADGVLTVVGAEREPVSPKHISINKTSSTIPEMEELPVAHPVQEDENEVVAETVSAEEATADEAASVSDPSFFTTTATAVASSPKEEGEWESIEKDKHQDSSN